MFPVRLNTGRLWWVWPQIITDRILVWLYYFMLFSSPTTRLVWWVRCELILPWQRRLFHPQPEQWSEVWSHSPPPLSRSAESNSSPEPWRPPEVIRKDEVISDPLVYTCLEQAEKKKTTNNLQKLARHFKMSWWCHNAALFQVIYNSAWGRPGEKTF